MSNPEIMLVSKYVSIRKCGPDSEVVCQPDRDEEEKKGGKHIVFNSVSHRCGPDYDDCSPADRPCGPDQSCRPEST